MTLCDLTDLQDVVEGDVTEALPGCTEDVGGLIHFMWLVPGNLSIFHQCHFLLLTRFIKLFLHLLKLPQIPDMEKCPHGIELKLSRNQATDKTTPLTLL